MAMRLVGVALLAVACMFVGTENLLAAGSRDQTPRAYWKAELEKANTGIKENPRSPFWHNQAGVAYDALGDFKRAEKEFTAAAGLDNSNPGHYYALYFFYKRRGSLVQQREALLKALDIDPSNPLGRYEFAYVLEKERHWSDALREYRVVRALVAKVKGPEYIDPRKNPFEVNGVRDGVDKAIERVAKLNASRQPENRRRQH